MVCVCLQTSYQLGGSHLNTVLLHGPAGCIKHNHPPTTEGTPQLGVPISVCLRVTQLAWINREGERERDCSQSQQFSFYLRMSTSKSNTLKVKYTIHGSASRWILPQAYRWYVYGIHCSSALQQNMWVFHCLSDPTILFLATFTSLQKENNVSFTPYISLDTQKYSLHFDRKMVLFTHFTSSEHPWSSLLPLIWRTH